MADDFEFDNSLPPDFLRDPLHEGDEASSRPIDDDNKEVVVAGVYEHKTNGTGRDVDYLVLLQDATKRTVIIVIGYYEAMSISAALERQTPPDRPLTHDLLNQMISKLGWKVEDILIDDLWNNTYYAKIRLTQNGKTVTVDSRPSDALALALRAQVPVFMAESIIASVGLNEGQK